MIENSSQFTPRESILMEYEREESKLAREFALAMKDKEIALSTLEIKWSSWLRIPLTIIRLPLVAIWLPLFGMAYVVSIFKKQPIEVSEMWRHLR